MVNYHLVRAAIDGFQLGTSGGYTVLWEEAYLAISTYTYNVVTLSAPKCPEPLLLLVFKDIAKAIFGALLNHPCTCTMEVFEGSVVARAFLAEDRIV
jgi:hypothetical protein